MFGDPNKEFHDAVNNPKKPIGKMFVVLREWAKAPCKDGDEFCNMIDIFNHAADDWMDYAWKRFQEGHPNLTPEETEKLAAFVLKSHRWRK